MPVPLSDVIGRCVSDLDLRILDVDARFAEIMAEPASSLVARHPIEFTHPDDRGRNTALLRRLIAEQVSFEITKRYVRGDGSVVWIRNHVSSFSDGAGPRRLLATCRLLGEERGVELRARWSAARRASALFRGGRAAFGDAVAGCVSPEALLMLYLVEAEGRQVTGDELARALCYPARIVGRWLRALAEAGLVEPEHGGRPGDDVGGDVPVLLSRDGFRRMEALLADVARAPGAGDGDPPARFG